jgi:hypothetical protein
MAARPEFKRAVLGLLLDAADRTAIDVAAGLAELLGLDLVGLFALDDSLRELAGYPGAREFVPMGSAWRPIDLDRIIDEQMAAAQTAQRVLTELASAMGVPATFEIVPGPAIEAFVSMSCASDILVVTEPARASAAVTRSFSLLFEAAIRSPASVLLVPRSARRRAGPIVVIAGAPDDPGIEVASAIAAAAHQPLIVIETFEPSEPGGGMPAMGAAPPTQRLREGGRALADVRQLSSLLEGQNESLIVITREGLAEATDNIGMAIAEQRRVPVLILEPPPRAP